MLLFLRSILWTLLCPGVVAVLLPWFITSGFSRAGAGLQWHQYPGYAAIPVGIGVLGWCIYAFARFGRGTLSPVDPARRLVIRGLYRYVRNPMYAGVMLVLLGEALLLGSLAMLGYATAVFLVFNLFIRLHEEPYLRRQFGEAYERYCKQVGRWGF